MRTGRDQPEARPNIVVTRSQKAGAPPGAVRRAHSPEYHCVIGSGSRGVPTRRPRLTNEMPLAPTDPTMTASIRGSLTACSDAQSTTKLAPVPPHRQRNFLERRAERLSVRQTVRRIHIGDQKRKEHDGGEQEPDRLHHRDIARDERADERRADTWIAEQPLDHDRTADGVGGQGCQHLGDRRDDGMQV